MVHERFQRLWGRMQLGRFLVIWWYATLGWSAGLIFVAALMFGADETVSVGSFGALLGMYLSVTGIIESVRSRKDGQSRFKVGLVSTAALAAAYLGLAGAMDARPATWDLAGYFFGLTAMLGILGFLAALAVNVALHDPALQVARRGDAG